MLCFNGEETEFVLFLTVKKHNLSLVCFICFFFLREIDMNDIYFI